ncbi:hypothetical protein Ahia01_000452700 [Argonauta hians]
MMNDEELDAMGASFLNDHEESDAVRASILDDDEEEEIFEVNHDKAILISEQTRQSATQSAWCGKFLKTVGLSGSFLGIGLCLAIPGVTLLDLKDRVGTTTEYISYIFTARSNGYLLGSILGGILFDHFDTQLQLSFTLLLTSVATITAPWCTSLIFLAIMISFQGIAMGVLDTGGNVFCMRIWGEQSGPYIQAMHFAFGAGAFIAPLLAKPFLAPDAGVADSNGSFIVAHPHLHVHFTSVPAKQHLLYLRNVIEHSHQSWNQTANSTANNPAYTAGRNGSRSSNSSSSNYSNSSYHSNSINTNASTLTPQPPPTTTPRTMTMTTRTLITLASTTSPRPKKPSIADGKFLKKTYADGHQIKDHLKHSKETAEKNMKNSDKNNNNNSKKNKSSTTLSPSVTPNNGSSSRPPPPPLSHTATATTTATTTTSNNVSGSSIPVNMKDTINATTTTAAANASNNTTTTTTSTTNTAVLKTTSPTTTSTTAATITTIKSKSVVLPSAGSSVASIIHFRTVSGASVTNMKVSVKQPGFNNNSTNNTNGTATNSSSSSSNSSNGSYVARSSNSVLLTKAGNSNPDHHTTSSYSPSSFSSSATTTTTTSSLSNLSVSSDSPTLTTFHPQKPETFDKTLSVKSKSRIEFAYLIIGVLLFFFSVFFMCLYCYDKSYQSAVPSRIDSKHKARLEDQAFRIQLLISLFIFFFMYVGMEVTFGGFIMVFAVEHFHWSKDNGALLNSLFWGALAAGRGMSIFITRCCLPSWMLVTNISLTLLASIILSFSLDQHQVLIWVGTLLFGLGLSSMFPTGMTWAESYMTMTGKSTAVLVVASALGEMALPALTGFLFMNHQMVLMYIILSLSLVCCLCFIIMHNLASNHQRRSVRSELPSSLEQQQQQVALMNASSSSSSLHSLSHGCNNDLTCRKHVTFKLDHDGVKYNRLHSSDEE